MFDMKLFLRHQRLFFDDTIIPDSDQEFPGIGSQHSNESNDPLCCLIFGQFVFGQQVVDCLQLFLYKCDQLLGRHRFEEVEDLLNLHVHFG